jgi:alpha-beta hydrolase superfamily lysophospholipase
MFPLVVLAATLLQAPASAVPPPDATAHARAALSAIAAGEFGKVEADFTSQMLAALPPGRLAAIWASLQAQAGAYKSCGTESRVVKISDKEMVITACAFERATIDVQFAFDTSGRISGLVFRPAAGAVSAYTPPAYANTSAYAESEKTIGSGDWALPGTLTLPAGAKSAAAVVLVHGSGPNDRDETIGANKPFKDLAAGLASRGIAVLRYDKRSRVHAARMAGLTDFTVQQVVIDDVLLAVKTLRSESGIDPARIFVVGHSLGGMLAPRIWIADPSIAGVIVLAGAARPLEDAIVAQSRYLAAADGTTSAEERQAIDDAEALAGRVRALQPEAAKSGQMIGGLPASYWLDLRSYDPTAAATNVKAPMLILQGGRDYQVTAEEFAKWKATLGGRRDVTFRGYPLLNHLFIAGAGPSLPAEYLVPGHVADDVVRDIADWIQAQRR